MGDAQAAVRGPDEGNGDIGMLRHETGAPLTVLAPPSFPDPAPLAVRPGRTDAYTFQGPF
jgi:hypothetical protein